MRYGYLPVQLAKHTGESRQVIAYHLGILQKNKLIYDSTKGSNKWKIYKITELGQNVLVQYESIEKKELKGVENARWKCQIRDSKMLQKFLFENGFKVHFMENWTQWNGEIQGFSISINLGKVTNLVITHPPSYSGDLQSAYHKINENILTIVSVLNKKWNFNLTIPEPISGRQYTMANGIADYLLDVSNGSQLKLMNGKISIDASKKGEPRIEFEELTEAHKFANLPDDIIDLKKQILETNQRMESQNEVIIQALSTLMKQSEVTSNALTTMLSMQNQGKIEQNVSPKEFKDDYGMFG